MRISKANNNIRDQIKDSEILITATGEKNHFKRDNTEKKSIPFQGKKSIFQAASKETLVRKKETYIYCQIGTKLLTSHSGGLLNT
ncbi:hypothetical protein MSMTP_0397 [Methanosarcina sp. MTP4]|uniref:hypothetical protein n=1 Tax=Methanosarcina sp. MTP4 TaxID=1434100 RepID=UPI000615ECFB|nr:hypothetical protein [Methanosarcina sp. MTP4]AKB23866.1 hypothetical protein MSMTP_0397 [Methanosarcina sp. MTP4]